MKFNFIYLKHTLKSLKYKTIFKEQKILKESSNGKKGPKRTPTTTTNTKTPSNQAKLDRVRPRRARGTLEY